MLPGTFQGGSLWPLGAFCWNVHSVWPCRSVNGIVRADSCLTSPCKQPSPFPFLRCSEQSWEELLPRQSGVAVRAADESNWKKTLGKKKKSQHGATCPYIVLTVRTVGICSLLLGELVLNACVHTENHTFSFQGRPLLNSRQVLTYSSLIF